MTLAGCSCWIYCPSPEGLARGAQLLVKAEILDEEQLLSLHCQYVSSDQCLRFAHETGPGSGTHLFSTGLEAVDLIETWPCAADSL